MGWSLVEEVPVVVSSASHLLSLNLFGSISVAGLSFLPRPTFLFLDVVAFKDGEQRGQRERGKEEEQITPGRLVQCHAQVILPFTIAVVGLTIQAMVKERERE